MNETHNKSASHGDDARLDRLVDGELPAGEYRELLASLDEQPGGWRRCALAFLESQALARELGNVRQAMDLRDEPEQPARVEPALREPPRAPRSLGPGVWKSLAIAASFLAAFSLGVWGPQWLRPRTNAGRVQQPVLDAALAQPASTGIVDWRREMQPGAGLGQRQQASQPIGNVQLVVDRGSGKSTSAGSLPVYNAPADVEGWLNQDRASLSPQVIQELQSRGHRVERQTQYVPVQLEDGRQIIVPVEGYQIMPADGPMY